MTVTEAPGTAIADASMMLRTGRATVIGNAATIIRIVAIPIGMIPGSVITIIPRIVPAIVPGIVPTIVPGIIPVPIGVVPGIIR